MKNVFFASLLMFALPAQAGVYGDSLGKCLVSSSSDRDKDQLMEWIFSSIALNPGIAPYVNLAPAKRADIDKNMAALFERLIGVSCKREASEALKFEGAAAFGSAFQLLGQVAGQQLFQAPQVSAGSEAFHKLIDWDDLQKKLELPESKS